MGDHRVHGDHRANRGSWGVHRAQRTHRAHGAQRVHRGSWGFIGLIWHTGLTNVSHGGSYQLQMLQKGVSKHYPRPSMVIHPFQTPPLSGRITTSIPNTNLIYRTRPNCTSSSCAN